MAYNLRHKNHSENCLLIEKTTLLKKLKNCSLCPRKCQVNRLKDERGYCQIGRLAKVASSGAHFGEEAELVGRFGSGTIFFSGCNLSCIFCQNYAISQLREGREVSHEELAAIILSLQGKGAHNINLVSPTHVVPQILEALTLARREGLRLPIVYNSGGYDDSAVLKLLEGIVDIYMPDAKYGTNEAAGKFSDAPNYPEINQAALREMHRQVGDLVVKDGVAIRGLLIRHLVLPENLAQSEVILKFIAGEISPNTYVNIMDQYRPCHKANTIPQLRRGINAGEFAAAIDLARRLGLHRGF